jgi:ABC-type multidrug transport system fused ATPase/permease subunit
VTLTLFPLLYLTLELPKRIINDAIGAGTDSVTRFGVEMSQLSFLMVLCGLFLLSVLGHGIMKMRINTMKGVLAERLLRRLRYTLIARILRFPAPYFERTSQGELVSMVTSESEPMGGLMGDAVAQPVLQAGQMITILGFLFLQSFTFGLAACAFIPLQAWLIPKLQRQVNLLNKKRVIQLRALAAEIGEAAAGAGTLRSNGGWRYRMSMIAARLGRLYAIRFEVYQKKFFMKFVNNFISQLTPFFFYAIGGYLAIRGDITVGALVAALAAYKDLSSPWKELLAYYNQSQDMALRWETITERFAPSGMIQPDLFDGEPAEVPHITGPIDLSGVGVQDADGNAVLEDISLSIPPGSTVAITAPSDEDRRAFAAVLAREVIPAAGRVALGDLALSDLHQGVIARRIGHASSRPVMFLGSFGENVLLPLRLRPLDTGPDAGFAAESQRAGNGADMPDATWADFAAEAEPAKDDLRARWREMMRGLGLDEVLFRRGIEQRVDTETQGALAEALIALRPKIQAAVQDKGLAEHVHFFHAGSYNPSLPVAENLIFATSSTLVTAEVLEQQSEFLDLLDRLGLEGDLLQLAAEIVELLRQIFGLDGTDHPLFRKLGLDLTTYEEAVALLSRYQEGNPLERGEKLQLLAVTFAISSEKIGTALPEEMITRVLRMRQAHSADLQTSMQGVLSPIDPGAPVAGLTVLENALFGRISAAAGAKGDALRDLISAQMRTAGLDPLVLDLIFDMPLSLGGANLPALLVEALALSRACIKRPDVLVLDNALASFDAPLRAALPQRLRALLPETTVIALAPSFDDSSEFDARYQMQSGRLSSLSGGAEAEDDSRVSADLARKLRALEQTDLFSGLDRKQLRLLAFGARWYEAAPGDYVFHKDDDPSSGAYLVVKGEAELLLPRPGEEDLLITTSGPGTLVGELGLIRNVPRALDMRAKGDLTCLRIGAEEFLDVVGSDASTAYKLLQVVAGYVSN